MSKKYIKETEEPTKSVGFCVYIGPTLVGVIQSGTIFEGTRAEVLKLLTRAVSICPLIPSLVVSGEDLAEAKINTKRPGNIMYVNYHKILSGRY